MGTIVSMMKLWVGVYYCVSVMKLSGVTGPGSRMMEEDEEVNWFDKDLDDFDIPTADNREDEEAEEDLGEWHWSKQLGHQLHTCWSKSVAKA